MYSYVLTLRLASTLATSAQIRTLLPGDRGTKFWELEILHEFRSVFIWVTRNNCLWRQTKSYMWNAF